MTATAPSPPPDRAPHPEGDPLPVPLALRWSMHLLVAAMLLLAAGRSIIDQPPGWPWVVTASALVAAVYLIGPHVPAVVRSSRVAGAWLALLLAGWLVLLALTADAIYLAFPWFFLLMHFLPRQVGLAAVAVTTGAAVAGFGWHQHTFTLAMVIGPVLGAAVAIATVLGYRALHAESERRQRVILELDRTREELAAAERRAGVLDERERLAREIHDTLAQGLSSIQLLLQAATRSLDPARGLDAGRAADLVEQARQAAQDNLAEARRVVRALAPGDLEGSTLAAALQRLCDTTTTHSGITVMFHQVGRTTSLPTPVEVALLRIAQAALANTTQHSGAGRADVTLTTMDSAVTLDVVDDGTGFDPDAPPPRATPAGEVGRRGFGLRSMRSRAAELGGVLTVESQPGSGTAVSVQFERAVVAPTLVGLRSAAPTEGPVE